ncbi:tyrosine-type recombinase/integrase [Laribacter hongkongensis]|uniref:tyrosine-type recombinase/integrase n=1 Tax=Laribacter hongkongensis TaxID=168471 RepID=UPI001EFEAC1D|nr:integrase family protein [Laribacter hongkongensis]MCG9077002.1 integrase family protein [Laribacter hongkongensis]
MAASQKLTVGFVEKATCEPGKAQTFYWDTASPGLGLRVTPSGAKAFIFQSRVNGTVVRVTIGDIRVWRLDAPAGSREPNARAEARRLQSLCDEGIDPRQEKADRLAAAEQKKQAAERQRVTLGEAWSIYIESRRHAWGERHTIDHIELAKLGGKVKLRGKGLTEPGVLAALIQIKLADLTPALIQSWVNTESMKRATRTALAFRCLSVFANWCEEQEQFSGLIPAGAFTQKRVKEAVHPVRRKEGDCLQKEMLPVWFAAVRSINNPVVSAYLQGLLITGARRRELSGLQWDDVDFRWRSMTIRDKVEGERTIPLTPYLASLIAMLPRMIRNDGTPSPFVFGSPSAADGRLQNPDKFYTLALRAADMPHISLHGLRRSFITLCEWTEAPSGVVAQIVGHKSSAVQERHYKRRPLDLLRQHHDRIEHWILEQAGIPQPSAEEATRKLRIVA